MTAQYHAGGRSARAIAEKLERDIDAGVYRGGDKLPTIRALADALGVSPTTVNAAFGILRAHGRIVGMRRGGSTVVSALALQSAGEPATGSGRNLAAANPDPAFLPLLRPTLARIDAGRHLYTEIVDDERLLAQMRALLHADRVDSTHLGIASGAMDAIERGLLAMTNPGDVIALEDPAFPPYAALATALGRRTVRMEVDGRGITPAGLRAAIRVGARAIVVVPRAHNPTGASFDRERARALRAVLATAPGVAAIEDDFLALVCGVPLHTITTGCTRWLHVRSLGKSFGPDIRVAPFAADALTHARIVARQRLGCGWVSTLLQRTAATLLRAPGTKRLIATATAAYAARRADFVTACRTQGIAAADGAGFTVWLPVRDESAAIRAAAAAGFAIDGGSRYRAGGPPAVRVVTTTLERAAGVRLARALARADVHHP